VNESADSSTHFSRKAIITGSSSGIGQATAELFKSRGWQVYGTSRSPERISDHTYSLEYGDEGSIRSLVQELVKDAPFHALVNNGGDIAYRGLSAGTPKSWTATFATVATGPALLTELFAAELVGDAEGAIVYLGSTTSFRGAPAVRSYAAAKSAIESITRSHAKMLAPNIRVNCVLPGFVDTPMTRSSPPDFVAEQVNRTPLGRLGRPIEIANTIYFLADSEASSFVTGHSLIVDGGHWIS
jgi:NAD(P)-dependent dehydrogenase (short-subunit alcohol dehydrogenase family)